MVEIVIYLAFLMDKRFIELIILIYDSQMAFFPLERIWVNKNC